MPVGEEREYRDCFFRTGKITVHNEKVFHFKVNNKKYVKEIKIITGIFLYKNKSHENK